MKEKVQSLSVPPMISEAINYLEKIANGKAVGRGQKVKQIEELYLQVNKPLQEILLRLVKAWGDQPAMRQILFFHYIHQESLVKAVLLHCIYPGLQHQKSYRFNESEIKFYLQQLGLSESQQLKSFKIFEKALLEMKMLSIKDNEKYFVYQRPTIEAIAYAFYAEYGDGFEQGKRFYLKNPPLEQIIENAAFPAYFLLDHRTIPMMLEACRIKNYISLEARGGLCQYALIYQDLLGLVEYMVQGGRV